MLAAACLVSGAARQASWRSAGESCKCDTASASTRAPCQCHDRTPAGAPDLVVDVHERVAPRQHAVERDAAAPHIRLLSVVGLVAAAARHLGSMKRSTGMVGWVSGRRSRRETIQRCLSSHSAYVPSCQGLSSMPTRAALPSSPPTHLWRDVGSGAHPCLGHRAPHHVLHHGGGRAAGRELCPAGAARREGCSIGSFKMSSTGS